MHKEWILPDKRGWNISLTLTNKIDLGIGFVLYILPFDFCIRLIWIAFNISWWSMSTRQSLKEMLGE